MSNFSLLSGSLFKNNGPLRRERRDRSEAPLQVGEQCLASLGRPCASHDARPLLASSEGRRWLGAKPGRELGEGKGLGVPPVRIEDHEQHRAAEDEPDAGMSVTVDAPLVTFGQAEETLEVEIVARQGRVFAADEEPRSKGAHDPRHLFAHRVLARFELCGKRNKTSFALLAGAHRGVEQAVDGAQDLDVPRHLVELRANDPPAAVYAGAKGRERVRTRAPFFAAVAFAMESRTSPSASAMRTPGGWSGPPWSSFRIPRTAAQ